MCRESCFQLVGCSTVGVGLFSKVTGQRGHFLQLCWERCRLGIRKEWSCIGGHGVEENTEV